MEEFILSDPENDILSHISDTHRQTPLHGDSSFAPEDETARNRGRSHTHCLHSFESERCPALSAHFGDLYSVTLSQNVSGLEPFDVPDISLGIPHVSMLSSGFHLVNDSDNSNNGDFFIHKEQEKKEEAIMILPADPQDPEPRHPGFTEKDEFLYYVSTEKTSSEHQRVDGCDVPCHIDEDATMEKETTGKRSRSASVGMDSSPCSRCLKLMKASVIDDNLVASRSLLQDVDSLKQDEDEERPLKPTAESTEEIEGKDLSPESSSQRMMVNDRKAGTEQNLSTGTPSEETPLKASDSFEQTLVNNISSVEEVLVQDCSLGEQALAAKDNSSVEEVLLQDCSLGEQALAAKDNSSVEKVHVENCCSLSEQALAAKENASVEGVLVEDCSLAEQALAAKENSSAEETLLLDCSLGEQTLAAKDNNPVEEVLVENCCSLSEQALATKDNSSVEGVLVENCCSLSEQALAAKDNSPQQYLGTDNNFYGQALIKDSSFMEHGVPLDDPFKESAAIMENSLEQQPPVKQSSSWEESLMTNNGNDEQDHLEDRSMEQRAVLRDSAGFLGKSLDEKDEKPGILRSYSTKVADFKLVPESVIDMVLNCSGHLSPPGLHDPDFLSLVIGSGVCLSLPLRDCSGKVTEDKL